MRHDQTPLQVFLAEPQPLPGGPLPRRARRDHTLPFASQPLAPPVPVPITRVAPPDPLHDEPTLLLPVEPPEPGPRRSRGGMDVLFDPPAPRLAWAGLEDAYDRPLRRIWRRILAALGSLLG